MADLSDQFRIPPQNSHGLSKLLGFQCCQILPSVFWGILQSLAASLRSGTSDMRGEINLAHNEIVGMKSVDPIFFGRVLWEVFKIECNNYVGTAEYGRRQNMAIIGIRELHRRDQLFVSLNQAVRNVGVHELASSL